VSVDLEGQLRIGVPQDARDGVQVELRPVWWKPFVTAPQKPDGFQLEEIAFS